MKKLLLSLFLCFTVTFSFAQKSFYPGLRFNPMLTWFKAETDNVTPKVSGNGIKMGFSYGLMGDYMFDDNTGLGFELRFAHLGGSYNLDSGKTSEHYVRNYKLQYIQLPVSLKMKTGEVGYMKFYGQFGIIPSINVRARGDIDYIKDGASQEITGITGDNINISKQVNFFNTFLS
ncbi:MAG: PorT family protein, partial [Bacteroidota bacterium]|nr:PorT family protein [Bacteroidota bacterium]